MKLSAFVNIVSKLSCSSKNIYHTYKNPCLDLQQYLEIPLFKDYLPYTPSINALLTGEDLFIPKSDYDIGSFFKTISTEKLPVHDLPEIAFMGRSNAGKSSLIKAIFRNVPKLNVKTSKKPGHTKCIHFFKVGHKMCLIDMPGYGKNQPEWFEFEIQNYLRRRKNLTKVFVITDGDIGIQEIDKMTFELLETFKIPYCVIITKIDKASDSRRLRSFLLFQDIKKECNLNCCFPQPFMLSSTSYEGLTYFMAFLGHITGSLNLLE